MFKIPFFVYNLILIKLSVNNEFEHFKSWMNLHVRNHIIEGHFHVYIKIDFILNCDFCLNSNLSLISFYNKDLYQNYCEMTRFFF